MDYVFEMPAEMLQETDKKGTVERFEYDTFTYDEENKPLHKGAWVYRPYGYDKSVKYNVLYLLHGGGFTEEWWLQMFPDTVTILDNMFEKNLCEPCIVVTPTFYHGDDDKHTKDEGRCENFRHELRKDLIPAIESKYSTFAEGDVSEENLIKTRSHRAFAGLSLGSMTTYRAAFYNNFDLFSWYGPFSGCCGPFGDHDKEVKRICETLENGYKNGYELDYMFCANGDADIAFEEHKDIMGRAVAESKYLEQGKNYDFFIVPGGVHDMKAWQLHMYHALQIFFKK
ncbi:alpha/beta hydrolase [Butyrivibrio sp. VCD2006]|uniref:alpha/beta hydrolase n=1 Tax=Butyrivibrio sp. VCD2006 TaxID=1280664 RepID=UPI000421BB5F|nr:alpha/beta hydrolase-fold protein [Butyrivibrio sp. VCD2006]